MSGALHSGGQAFLDLHVPGRPLLIPNPWDAGSAKVLASLGFRALATTSGGHAATLGRLDGEVTREEALAHAAQIVAAVDVPVSADLESGFGADPAAVAETMRAAAATGLAGCSIEDYSGDPDTGLYDIAQAADRVRAAAEAAGGMVLTARAENFFRHRDADLGDAIARLQAYQEAGADVLYAPGLSDPGDVARLIAAVDRPVNVLAYPGLGSVGDLAAAGAARISVGGAFAYVALGALVQVGRELLDEGSFEYLDRVGDGRRQAQTAFSPGGADRR
ncbi:MAG: isocitrate lyase/phosphoenolpyruvate mutase family protein [Geodermatophilaceae bacterium]|nr:isocitrate lyase/phosphoenolpyruvate mutase family protein [Geodermatophilaceae bacterium]